MNDVPVKKIHRTSQSVVYILEKILYIRPEDVDAAVSRLPPQRSDW